MKNKIWRSGLNGCILYTESKSLIRLISQRVKLKGKTRTMAEYYKSVDSASPFAWQIIFHKAYLKPIAKMAGCAECSN